LKDRAKTFMAGNDLAQRRLQAKPINITLNRDAAHCSRVIVHDFGG